MLCPVVFGIVCFILHTPEWDVHGQYQIDILALDSEDCQKNMDYVRYQGVELANELVTMEDYWRGGVVSLGFRYRYRGDPFYRAGCS